MDQHICVTVQAPAPASGSFAAITTPEKQELALTNLPGFCSTCAGMAALANQAINEGELTIETAQHLANLAEKLQQESNVITHLLSDLFLNGASYETDRK